MKNLVSSLHLATGRIYYSRLPQQSIAFLRYLKVSCHFSHWYYFTLFWTGIFLSLFPECFSYRLLFDFFPFFHQVPCLLVISALLCFLGNQTDLPSSHWCCRRKCDTWWWVFADFLKWLYVLQQLKIVIQSDLNSLSQWPVYSFFLSSFPGGLKRLVPLKFHLQFYTSSISGPSGPSWMWPLITWRADANLFQYMNDQSGSCPLHLENSWLILL